jgi:hypothetical protein
MGQGLDMHKEMILRPPPGQAIGGQATSRDEIVNMRVIT